MKAKVIFIDKKQKTKVMSNPLYSRKTKLLKLLNFLYITVLVKLYHKKPE